MQYLRIRREEFENLLTPVELHSDTVCLWAVAPPYVVVNDTIISQAGKKSRLTFPLSDPNLFLSFARLGSQGEPSESSILRWVNARGLLRGQDRLRESDFSGVAADGAMLDLEPQERIKQDPMTTSDFRREVRCANQILRLYRDVRGRDYEAVAEWLLGPLTPRDPAESTIVERFLERWHGSAVYAGVRWMLDQGMTTRRDEGEWLIGDAESVLIGAVAYSVRDVRLTLTRLRMPGDEGQDPLLARRTMRCPDLLSAIYFQFYLMFTDNKPMHLCENPVCRMPFPVTRKGRRFCGATCRSNARHFR